MKRLFFLLTVLLALALGACQGSPPVPEETETPPPAPTASESTETPSADPAAPEATATPDDYPAQPTASAPESGYPAAPEESAPPSAYPPGEPVWVLRPLGEQCAEESTFEYASLEEAVSALEEADVNVLASETVSLMVCEACGCPTSDHYRVQIMGEDVETVRSMGWRTE
ncbi:MAG: hypothetical protein R3248_07300 [Candidatus Promineifilaceae bacterium]|nr:hypothetical protein [Candidatus Promineifilaceae bacterium]